MVYEALKDTPLNERDIDIWTGKERFGFLNEESVVFIPILRAGLPMLEGTLKVVPNALSGFLAIKRDEETLASKVYYSRLPSLEGKTAIILDPMLATGGTLEVALREILSLNPLRTFSLHIISSPEGVKRIQDSFPEHKLFVVKIDKGLNSKGFIIPGLGDMGDRLFS